MSSFCQVIKWHERHSTEIQMWLKMGLRLKQEHNCFLCNYLKENEVKEEWLVDDMEDNYVDRQTGYEEY